MFKSGGGVKVKEGSFRVFGDFEEMVVDYKIHQRLIRSSTRKSSYRRRIGTGHLNQTEISSENKRLVFFAHITNGLLRLRSRNLHLIRLGKEWES